VTATPDPNETPSTPYIKENGAGAALVPLVAPVAGGNGAADGAPRTAADALVVAAPPRADRHPAAVYLARLGRGSRRTVRGWLDAVAGLVSGGRADAGTLDWAALRYPHTAAVRAALAGRYAPATANGCLAALRGVLKECWRLGLLSAEDLQRACDLAPVRGERLPRGRALAPGELRALLATCADPARLIDVRDAALLGVLYGAGLRRAELVALDLADYDPDTGALTVRSGKGNKARLTYAEGGARTALLDWCAARGGAPGPLFRRIRKGNTLTPARLTPQAVLHVVRTRVAAARVAPASPHDFRRTFISDLLDAGADLAAVQQLAGHANLQTTARYDRRGERAKRKAASLLHVPQSGLTGRGER
jgi:integrase